MSADTREKAVIRFLNGEVRKGFLINFSDEADHFEFQELEGETSQRVEAADLKAIFFVKSFEGDRNYREAKSYGHLDRRGTKVYLKFKDKEGLVGYTADSVPWEKGFHLSQPREGKTGFFVEPVDLDSNNNRVFVIASSIEDVTVIVKQKQKQKQQQEG